LKVGQKVYLKPIGNRARYSKDIVESSISKIGRKYFKVEDDHYGRFFIDTMKQDNGQYISEYACYTSREKIESEKEIQILYDKIKKMFYTLKPDIPLEKLKRIDKIINTN